MVMLLFSSLHTCSASLLSLPGPHQHPSLHLKSLLLISILAQFGGALALLFDRGALGSECVFEIVFEISNFGITGLELPPHFPSHFVSFSASIQSRFCQPVTPSLLPASQVCSPIHVPSALLILCYNNKQCSTRSAK